MHLQNTDGYLADSLSLSFLTIERLVADYWPSVNRLSTDIVMDTTYSKHDPRIVQENYCYELFARLQNLAEKGVE